MRFIVIFLFSCLFTQELEVQGDLKVTGSVESTTIDSLKALIAQLQAQLAALQAQGGLETRIFQLPTYTFQPYQSEQFILNLNEITGMDISHARVAFFSIDNYSIYNENNQSGTSFNIIMEGHHISSGSDYWTQTGILANGELTLYDVYKISNTFSCIMHEHSRMKISYGGDPSGGTFTFSIAVTAQFPN